MLRFVKSLGKFNLPNKCSRNLIHNNSLLRQCSFPISKIPGTANTCRSSSFVFRLSYSTAVGNEKESPALSLNAYEKTSEETLESLSEVFEELLENKYNGDIDISLANGVLTIQLENHGTYVINKQTPNRQIWLSSPTSGPKRYDFISGQWIYRHDGMSLHQLLRNEFSEILEEDVDLSNCSYAESK